MENYRLLLGVEVRKERATVTGGIGIATDQVTDATKCGVVQTTGAKYSGGVKRDKDKRWWNIMQIR